MLSSFLSGFLAGFALCLSFGTVFFALIQNSVDNGYQSGVKISLGGMLSDLMFISVALFGTLFLPKIDHFDIIMQGIGAFFLIILGISSWKSDSPKIIYPKTKVGNLLYYVGLGFTLNSINPVNFFIWAAAAASIKHYDSLNTFLFFLGAMGAIFLTQFIICYYAHALQKYFNPTLIKIINRSAGLVFLGTGIYLASIVISFIFKTNL
jgi:threonine/homoserine/homoserine lactone efflux protein